MWTLLAAGLSTLLPLGTARTVLVALFVYLFACEYLWTHLYLRTSADLQLKASTLLVGPLICFAEHVCIKLLLVHMLTEIRRGPGSVHL